MSPSESAGSYDQYDIHLEGKVTTWEPLSDMRMATSLNRLRQGIMTLQVAWRCREDGRIEWRNVPMHVLTEEEYATTVATQST